MTALSTAFVEARLDTSSFGSDIRRGMASPTVGSASTDAGKTSASKYSGAFGSALKIGGALVAAFAVTKGITFFKDSVSEASNLNEVASKLGVVFGESAKGIQRFSSTAATSLGQSKLAAQEAAATFGVFGKVAGLNEKENSKFSVSLTKLASDMASFSNTTPEQAVEALGSALRGESEPIRQYGVLMDEASLKAEALAQGIIKPVKNMADIKLKQDEAITSQKAYNDAVAEFGKSSFEATKARAALALDQDQLSKATDGTIEPLTQQQKVLAAQSLIMKQTSDAQGDFGRTSGGLANQQRILSAQFDNVKASVGEALLPVVTKLFTFFTEKGMPALQDFGGVLKSFGGFVKDNSDLIKPLVIGLGGLAVAVGIVSGVTAAYNAILLLNPITLVVVAIAALTAGLIIAYKRSDTFREIVDKAFTVVKQSVKDAWEYVYPALKAFAEFVTDDLGPAIVWFWQKIVKPTFKLIGNYIEWYWDHVIKPVFQTLAKFIKDDLAPAIEWLWKNVVKPTFESIGTGIEWTWDNVIKPTFQKLGSFIKKYVAPAFKAGVKAIGEAWDTLKKIVGTPIYFVLETIINQGLLEHGFNKLADFFEAPNIPLIDTSGIPHFAKGGITPGFTPGRDVHRFTSPTGGVMDFSGGEAVMVPEWTRAVGSRNVRAMNEAARAGRFGPQDMKFAEGGVVWPVPGHDTGTYPGHDGVDINRGSGWDDFGDTIVAAMGGKVNYVGWDRGYGDAIFIDTTNGFQNIYGHTSANFVHAGQTVATGQAIGRVGNTGNSSAPHLHFGVVPGLSFEASMAFLSGASKLGPGNFTAQGLQQQSLPGYIADALKDPKGFLMDRLNLDGIVSGPVGDILKSVPGKIADFMVDKIKGFAKGLADTSGKMDAGVSSTNPEIQKMIAEKAAAYGWTSQLLSLLTLVDHESSFDPNAQNPDSSAYGLFQFLDSTWASVGATKTSDPGLQTDAGLKYIDQRYTDPNGAWGFWQNNGWYDNGGVLKPGLTMAYNGTGQDETVRTAKQDAALKDSAKEIAAAVKSLISDIKRFAIGDTASDARSAISTLLAALKAVVGKDSPLLNRFSDLGDKLVAAARSQDGAVAKYDKATDKLGSLEDASRQLAQSVSAAYVHDAFGTSLAESKLQLRADVNDAIEVTSDLARVRRRGFGGAAYRMVAESGNTQLINQLAHSSRREIAQYERLVSRRATTTGALGRQAADALLGRGITQQTKVVAHLDRTIDRLNDRLDSLEHAVERAARKGTHDGARAGVGDNDRRAATRRKAR